MSSFQVTQLKVKNVLHPESTGTLTIETVSFKNGLVTMPEAGNFAFGTTTGTKLGTATSQKLGFFNATPVVQPAGTADVLASLVTLGLRAASSNPPLNLGTGGITCGAINIGDASDVAIGTTTGTKIGTTVTQKLGFWNATPIVQPVGAGQAALTALTTVGSNNATSAVGLSLIADTSTGDRSAAIMTDLLSLQEDITQLGTLVSAIRTALVNAGLMKGAA